MKRILCTAAAIILGSAAFIPSQAFAQVDFSITIGNAPPPPRYEVVPPPRYGYVWVPGFWDWNGRRHVWVGGHWEQNRPGYIYQRPQWRHEGNAWRLEHGGWQRNPPGRGPHDYRGHSRGDWDRDGVPNRYDRWPDDPRRH